MTLYKEHRLPLAILAIGAILFGGSKPPSPPVVMEEGIEIKSYKADAKGATFEWVTKDDRIEVGKDVFIVEYRERQIAPRTGYSAWRKLGETKEEKFSSNVFLRNRDIIVRISVDKGAIIDE
jgi:hypothetical protein